MMTQQRRYPLRIDGLDEYQEKLIDASPAWLKGLRRRSVALFTEAGLPTVKDEEWKYTPLVDVFNRHLRVAVDPVSVDEAKLRAYQDEGDIHVVLVNGVFNAQLSGLGRLPKGLSILPFQEAAGRYSQEMELLTERLTPNDSKAFVSLNHALFTDGVFVRVQDNAVIEPLIHIIHATACDEPDVMVFPRSMVIVGKNAQASIMESHVSLDAEVYVSDALTDIRVGEGAVVQYCKAEAENVGSVHIAATRIWQEAASTLESFAFAHGALLTRNNLSIFLKGEGANTVVNGFYAIDGQQHVDNHTFLDIRHPHCTTFQFYKGLLNGAAHAVFNGKIYVHPEAQKTDAYQLNKHLLLGPEARVDTKPQLEIFADDVKCTHGATIGQLSEDEVFYLQSRCISRTKAVQLLSKGFMDDIINTVKSLPIRRKLNKLLSVKFPEVKL
ncbi:MAG: Fe-S cluster assembly protein SufD [Candidatus Omnitrophica bacterium]|nr:Fe-S cluster assembly protein SufD [Candidatus Omnitrophota bacterium]